MVIKDTIYYEPAAEDRMLHIYLPDDYDSSGERYPVMYFWDGHNLFFDSDATYGKSWGLVQYLSSWDHKLIVVGIECSHQGSHRLDEYCPYDSELMGTQIHGEGWETMEWMTGVLKPYIDGKFRTLPSRESTAIGGASMGGLMSLYAVTRYNHVYSRAACLSSSIFMVQDPLRQQRETLFPLLHYMINPSYAELDYNVPYMRKLALGGLAAVTAVTTSLIFFKKLLER